MTHICLLYAQNLGEAEMVVSVYMYMRLRGYPAAQISILSPYNGQVALLRDVIERRCAQHPAFGRPHKACIPSPRLLLPLVTAMGFHAMAMPFLLSTDQDLLNCSNNVVDMSLMA